MLSRRDLFAGMLGAAAAAALPKRTGSAEPELPAFPPLHDEVVRRAFEEPRGPFEIGDWIKYTDGTGTHYGRVLSVRKGEEWVELEVHGAHWRARGEAIIRHLRVSSDADPFHIRRFERLYPDPSGRRLVPDRRARASE